MVCKETLICNFMDDESGFFFFWLRLSYLIGIRFVYTFHIVGNLNYAPLDVGLIEGDRWQSGVCTDFDMVNNTTVYERIRQKN